MIRFLYSLLFYFVQPLIWCRLAWRARRQPDYLRHLGERYGFHAGQAPERVLWLHAVSVGETRAAEPLIKALLAEYPDRSLLLTHMTPTGRAGLDADHAGGPVIAPPDCTPEWVWVIRLMPPPTTSSLAVSVPFMALFRGM